MKNKITMLFFVFLLSAWACQQKQEHLIIGNWKTESFKIENLEAVTNRILENFPDSQHIAIKAQIENSYKNLETELQSHINYFNFNKDKTFGYEMAAQKGNGTWRVTDDGKFLITVESTDNRDDTAQIAEISKQRLVLSSKQSDGSLLKMTLVKNQ